MNPPPATSLARRFFDSPWVWLAPVLIPFALFLFFPLIEVFRLSFHEWDWFEETPVGFDHYRRLMNDPQFKRALVHTLVFTAVVVPAWIFSTMAIASLIAPMTRKIRSGWTAIFYLTYLVSPLVLAMIWSWMLAPDASSVANRVIGWIGMEPLPWLASSKMALAGVIISTVFTIPGTGVLLYSAAIASLPDELYEAAEMEGASKWDRWRTITMPLLRPTTLYLSVIYTIASFQVFERVYMMTGGGPAGATSVLVEQIYTDAFLGFNFGEASAQSVILFGMIAAVAWGQFKFLKSDFQY